MTAFDLAHEAHIAEMQREHPHLYTRMVEVAHLWWKYSNFKKKSGWGMSKKDKLYTAYMNAFYAYKLEYEAVYGLRAESPSRPRSHAYNPLEYFAETRTAQDISA